jgi:hypothetical protein
MDTEIRFLLSVYLSQNAWSSIFLPFAVLAHSTAVGDCCVLSTRDDITKGVIEVDAKA